MDGELRRLLDEAAMRDVLARYARAIDRMDWDLLRSCYHPDAIDEHGRYNGDVEGFIAWLERELPAYSATLHTLNQQRIEIDGDAAFSETYCVAYHRSADQREDRTLLVRYCDRFERRDGEWRIAHRRCVYEWVRIDPVSEGSQLPPAYQRGVRGASDPSNLR
jgi:ketosteroid isomerase-like protein